MNKILPKSDTPRTDDLYFNHHPTVYDMAGLCKELERENAKMRGIIARNAKQRLNDDAMHITPQDIKDSLEILYAEQEKEKKP